MNIWIQLAEEIRSFTNAIRSLPVAREATPQAVRARVEQRYSFEEPVPLDILTSEVADLLRTWAVHVTHPRYFGLFNPSVREAGIVADALVALYNPQLAVWSHAPAAQEIERITLHVLARSLGFDPGTSLANFTSGGAEANSSALLAAIAHRCPEVAEAGVGAFPAPPVVYVSAESHHSFVKAARMAGLGTNALIEVPLLDDYRMDPEALAHLVEADRRGGRFPLMVVGTAGTTSAGLIDPLSEIAEIAGRAGIWFHADAAWGGSAALSSSLRPALDGIERADSVTWDAHKWLSVPMGAGMFFCRHPEAVRRAFGITTSYMPAGSGGDTQDPYAVTAQWSRRLIGLKVFMSLAELGLEGYARQIDGQAAMAGHLRIRLQATGWLIRNQTPLPVVCFSHPDIEAGRVSTADLLANIYARGRVWISEVVLAGRERVLRACITSFRSDESDIECLIEELEQSRVAAVPKGAG